MIFLSAQPDHFYFLWQLKLQINNFISHGIEANQIHILIGYDKQKGLNPVFQDWIKELPHAKIFVYPDLRLSKSYASSIRPHIISEHFRTYDKLAEEQIFYHDSDVLFSRVPNFNRLEIGNIWYASDTRSYLDSDYVISKVGLKGLEQMAKIVGIRKSDVTKNDHHAGGAQYLLKNVPVFFWEKLERDCEKMFNYLETLNNKHGFVQNGDKKIQSWCTDMWCLWWNAILFKKEFHISRELDFVWAFSNRAEEDAKPIIHYTGNVSELSTGLFRKNNYGNCTPFYDDFSEIDMGTSSYSVVEEIVTYNKNLLQFRKELSDMTFLIPLRIDSEERLENFYLVVNYLFNNFVCHVIVLEADISQKINLSKCPVSMEYHFFEDFNEVFHRTKYNNTLIRLAKTKYISLYDTDVIIPPNQMFNAYKLLKDFEMVYPYDGSFISLDVFMKAMFSKMPDYLLFEENLGKHRVATKRSYGGCVFLVKDVYIQAGLENEHFSSWGPEDLERRKRMLILGFSITRVSGNLYHLSHPRSKNSGYISEQIKIELMEEYLRICGMEYDSLKNYIAQWPWVRNKIEIA